MINLPSPKDCPVLLIELDAAGQEARFMADLSQDKNMLSIFNRPPPDDDLHSFMGSVISGMSFDAFLEAKIKKLFAVVGPRGFRYQGKFINLSCQYRIGVRALRIKARIDYDMVVDFGKAQTWKKNFLKAYPSVKDYWADAIDRAKQYGYAETLGGRRFAITMFDNPEMEWASEQSAINTPIQGSGADQKELGIAMLTDVHPNLRFSWDLHDGLFYRVPNTASAIDQALEARETLNNLPYEEAWGWEPSLPMPWDVSIGPNWGSLEEL